MTYIAQFLNMAFPKAGVLVHSIPVTAATIFFALSLLYILIRDHRSANEIPPLFWKVYLLFVLMVFLSLAFNIHQIGPRHLAMTAVLIGSPLAILLGLTLTNSRRAYQIAGLALLIAGIYAIIQYLFGIEETTINGLNLALGDSWNNKPIAIWVAQTPKYVKWPATYQNGNLAAAFYILAIPLLLSWRSIELSDRWLRFSALVTGFVGLLLSGARSALYPFALIWIIICIVYVLWQRGNGLKDLLMWSGCIVLVFMAIGQVKPDSPPYDYMLDRYVLQTKQDPTASGRTMQWKEALKETSQQAWSSRLQIFTLGWDRSADFPVEGFLAVAMLYGFIAMTLFVLLFLVTMYQASFRSEANQIIALGLLAGFCQFLIDSPFLQPPTLINWFFVAGLALNQNKKDNSRIEPWIIRRIL
ncbi:MAG: hypothetical protein CVU90_10770 [Firmicutes bacterium HGW-Firmicutes-15]|nr:MAG: hypothetical protein CVU90_10770 [Firmicutes bacterium HGW-Firmicutes-15]